MFNEQINVHFVDRLCLNSCYEIIWNVDVFIFLCLGYLEFEKKHYSHATKVTHEKIDYTTETLLAKMSLMQNIIIIFFNEITYQ